MPAGMRPVLSYLVKHRMVDCVVSTGANLFHDLYETLGAPHWQHPSETDDVALGRLRFNRFYDVLAPETDFTASEDFVVRFIRTLDPNRPYTTREFFSEIGKALLPVAKNEGILTAAARSGVPVYSSAIGDSMYGLAGNVMSGTLEHSLDVARRLRAGFIGVNGGAPYGADVPFGGYKASGVGRQNGYAGFDQYLEIKSVAWPAS